MVRQTQKNKIDSYNKEKKSKLLKAFLFISILGGFFIIVNLLLTKFNVSLITSAPNLDFLVSIFMFVFGIICFLNFRKNGFAKITFVLPLLNIILFLIFLLTGMVFGILNLIYGFEYLIVINSTLLLLLNQIFNVLEIVFAFYLLYLFRK